MFAKLCKTNKGEDIQGIELYKNNRRRLIRKKRSVDRACARSETESNIWSGTETDVSAASTAGVRQEDGADALLGTDSGDQIWSDKIWN